MVTDIVAGPRMAVLGGALQPALRRVEAALDEPARPTGRGESFIAVGERTLGHLVDALEHLEKETELLHRALAPDLPEAEIHRAVGRYEVVLDGLLQCHAELRQARPRAAHQRGHRLLVTAFRRMLIQIRDWLREVVDIGADPVQVLKRKGLPTSGHVTLDLTPQFTTPEEMDQFVAWADGQARAGKSSFWNGIVAFAAGWFLGGLFLGDDD